MENKKTLPPEQHSTLLQTLKDRFEKNTNRHKDLEWNKIQAKLEASPEKLWSLNEMERTGGEPDVVGYDKTTNEYLFKIVPQKVPRNAEAFVMTSKHWIQEKKINQKTAPLQWLLRWASNF